MSISSIVETKAKINGYLIVAIVWVASLIIVGFTCLYYGARNEKLNNFELTMLAENAGKAAQKGAAIEISKIRVRNTVVQGRIQTIVKDNPVYRDCEHDDAAFRLLNDALTGQEPSDSSVPRSVSPKR